MKPVLKRPWFKAGRSVVFFFGGLWFIAYRWRKPCLYCEDYWFCVADSAVRNVIIGDYVKRSWDDFSHITALLKCFEIYYLLDSIRSYATHAYAYVHMRIAIKVLCIIAEYCICILYAYWLLFDLHFTVVFCLSRVINQYRRFDFIRVELDR